MAEIETYPEADCAEGCLHPRAVYDLIGHNEAEEKFLQAKLSGRLHHAWLLTGATGIGKATLAYRIIRYMLGGQSLLENSLNIPQSDPVAQRIEALGHGNFVLLRRPYDHKTKKIRTDIPIADVRKLSKFFENTASESETWRVCLIDSADDLNRNSENGILKLLEEPPDKTLFLLLSSAPGRLLPTIRSRCMQLSLRPVPNTQIDDWMRQHVSAPDDVIDAAVKLSRGAPGKALSFVRDSDQVLRPLSRFLSSLDRSSRDVDMSLAKSLSAASAANTRALFWDALQDILQAQAVFCATGEWHSAFKPLPVAKSAQAWEQAWERVKENQRVEAAINLDKTAVMFDTLSMIRAA